MINRIMKTGVVAVALAASALLATSSAHAQRGSGFGQDRPSGDLRGGPDSGFADFGNRRAGPAHVESHGKLLLNEFGQTPEEVDYLAAEALEVCACQLELDAIRYGFKDARFGGTPYLEQVGRNRFVVKGQARLFDGYDRSHQSYDCVVRRGKISDASRLHPATFNRKFDERRRNRFDRRRGISGISFSFGQIW